MTPERHLVHVFATFAQGGPQVRTCQILNALGPAYRHTIIAMDGDASCRSRLNANIQYEVVPPAQGKGPIKAWRMGALLGRLRPDGILTSNWGSMDAVMGLHLRGLTRRWIHAEDGFNPDEAQGQKTRRVLARRFLLRKARAVVVPSHVLEGIARDVWHVPRAKLERIPNGIPTDRFVPGDAVALRNELGIPENALVVGTVAYLREVKNPFLLLETCAALMDDLPLHLVIVGEGPLLDPLVERARALNREDRIHFPGRVSEPIAYYRLMDVFALSSHSEQMPVAVVEAMACGKPILSTAVGDVRQMVCQENADFVIPPGDAARYAPALEALLRDPALRARLGEANRAVAQSDYSEDAMLARYRALYDGITAR